MLTMDCGTVTGGAPNTVAERSIGGCNVRVGAFLSLSVCLRGVLWCFFGLMVVYWALFCRRQGLFLNVMGLMLLLGSLTVP